MGGPYWEFLFNVFHIPGAAYAVWSGSSIHEVAQVAAAGSILNNTVFEALASSVKMIRVLLIVPFTIMLMLVSQNNTATVNNEKIRKDRKITIPWFAIFFFLVVIVNSFPFLPSPITGTLITADNWMMAAAMAGLGLDISLKSLMGVGRKAFILGISGSLFISTISAIMITLLM